ncbi:MAG TPA: hypothetical protein DDW52_14950 [Planctomycetaceae bacterium]|nr:hypothetical protein [Planctomycetaceae bacterium]
MSTADLPLTDSAEEQSREAHCDRCNAVTKTDGAGNCVDCTFADLDEMFANDTPAQSPPAITNSSETQANDSTDALILETLRQSIEYSHDSAVQSKAVADEATRDALKYAITAGRDLVAAKRWVPFGEWGKWQQDNLSFSRRTAQEYMLLYRQRDCFLDDDAPTSITQALAKLRQPECVDDGDSGSTPEESPRDNLKNAQGPAHLPLESASANVACAGQAELSFDEPAKVRHAGREEKSSEPSQVDVIMELIGALSTEEQTELVQRLEANVPDQDVDMLIRFAQLSVAEQADFLEMAEGLHRKQGR